MDSSRAEAVARLRTVLATSGLSAEAVDEFQTFTVLAGDFKRTIPVLLDVGERALKVSSLFAGAPDEGHREVYELLLHRNERARWVHFALQDGGDIVLTGRIPLVALDDDVIEELLGELLTVADAAFNTVLRTGFAGYLAGEQRWRALRGMPPNPAGEN